MSGGRDKERGDCEVVVPGVLRLGESSEGLRRELMSIVARVNGESS